MRWLICQWFLRVTWLVSTSNSLEMMGFEAATLRLQSHYGTSKKCTAHDTLEPLGVLSEENLRAAWSYRTVDALLLLQFCYVLLGHLPETDILGLG